MKTSIRKALRNKNFRFCCALALALAYLCSAPALAADDPLKVIGNLSTFMFSVIRAIG